MFVVVFLTLCAGAAASSWRNLADPLFVRVDPRELPEAAAMSLAQDSAGFVWVGTQGGLARFDGYRFRSFLPHPSDPKALPDGYLRSLLADAAGGLWIGSSSNGLVHFDAASETFHTWRPGPGGPRSAAVNALAVASDGGLWVGGDRGLDYFDVRAKRFEAVVLAARAAAPVVWSVFVDRAGTVWVGTQQGLYARRTGASRFSPFRLTAGRQTQPPVFSFYEDRARRLWVGSVNAVFVLDRARRNDRTLATTRNPDSLAPGQQWAITEIAPGLMWIGTDGALSAVNLARGQVRRIQPDVQNPGGFSSGRVVQFLRGRSGEIWLANHVGGLLLYDPFSQGLHQISGTRPEIGFGNRGMVAVAAAPGDRLWAGGFFGRLAEFDARSGRERSVTLPNHAAVQALRLGSDGTLWIGTTIGLCRLAAGVQRPECPAGPRELAGWSVYAVLEDGPRLWIGGSGGLLLDDRATGKIRVYGSGSGPGTLSNSQVRDLYWDRRGRLWIGTENGLNRLDPDGRIVRFVFSPSDPNSIGPGGVATIAEDRMGRIWVGAAGGPLNVIEETPGGRRSFRRLGREDGLPNENVDGVTEDAHGRIWASTDLGIALIDPHTLRARPLGLPDGVSQNAFWASAVSRSPDGTIFFGGLDGTTVIDADASSTWTYAPPLVVTALAVGRHSLPAWKVNGGAATIDLLPDARDITVEFAALDYSAPQLLRYAYRLDGYDQEWVETDATRRVATYTRLAPGTYTLELRGTNRLGVWSNHALRLNLRVMPAWYETWWFRSLLLVAVIVLAFGVYRLRTAVLRQRQRELEALVKARTHELSAANAKLEEMSLSDPLTGLRNRRFLTQHLGSDIALTLRRYEDWNVEAVHGEPPQDGDLLFFLVDLDNFKTRERSLRPSVGRHVLMQMRERLQEVFRESDFVVRWGGDEFLAVARGSRRSEAGRIAERIREAVGRRPFELTLGTEQRMSGSASIGFAAFPFVPIAPNALSWIEVVGLADHALYMAKEAGRNTWFGLAASARTDPEQLVRHLTNGADEAVLAGALAVLSADRRFLKVALELFGRQLFVGVVLGRGLDLLEVVQPALAVDAVGDHDDARRRGPDRR